MLAIDPDIFKLDSRHLRNWWALAVPAGIGPDASYALLILQQGTLVHAIRSGHGSLQLDEVPFIGTAQWQLQKLKSALKVDAVMVLEQDAIADLFENMQRSLRVEHDMATQGVGLWQSLRKSEGIWSEPALLDLIPPLRSEALQKTFNLLIPNNTSLSAYIFDDHERNVHASVIALKGVGKIELATMHPAIGDLVTERELCRDWRSQYHRVNQALSQRFARPSVSIFVERQAVDRILRGPADQLAKELKERHVIVDPAPLWLQGLLGGAAVAAVASTSAKRVARFLPKPARKLAGGLVDVAQERMKSSSANPFAMLGFDPIKLLQSLRGFYADSEQR